MRENGSRNSKCKKKTFLLSFIFFLSLFSFHFVSVVPRKSFSPNLATRMYLIGFSFKRDFKLSLDDLNSLDVFRTALRFSLLATFYIKFLIFLLFSYLLISHRSPRRYFKRFEANFELILIRNYALILFIFHFKIN